MSKQAVIPARLNREVRAGRKDTSIPLFLAPFALLFVIFIAVPIIIAIGMSFTYFNSVSPPMFSGADNYLTVLTQDRVFMENVLPNTLQIAIVAGPVALVLQFLLAWALAQIPKRLRTVLALLFYMPSLTNGIALAVVWKIVFSGDRLGYLNNILMTLKIIEGPVAWLTAEYILPIMIIVTLWSSMGIGFLSMLSSILNINPELYDAGYVDGIKNRFHEMIYITIPSMKPALLFATVMSIVNTFSVGQVGIDLTGANPTPNYAGQTFVSHIMDHGLIQFEMGYAAALSVILLLIIFGVSRLANRLLIEK